MFYIGILHNYNYVEVIHCDLKFTEYLITCDSYFIKKCGTLFNDKQSFKLNIEYEN